MSKILKLTGIKVFTTSVCKGTLVQKGQTVKFSDAVADKLLKSFRRNAEGDPVPYWTEMPEDTVPDHNFDGTPQVEMKTTVQIAPQADSTETAKAVAKTVARSKTTRQRA